MCQTSSESRHSYRHDSGTDPLYFRAVEYSARWSGAVERHGPPCALQPSHRIARRSRQQLFDARCKELQRAGGDCASCILAVTDIQTIRSQIAGVRAPTWWSRSWRHSILQRIEPAMHIRKARGGPFHCGRVFLHRAPGPCTSSTWFCARHMGHGAGRSRCLGPGSTVAPMGRTA
jgi:hypothetical protein